MRNQLSYIGDDAFRTILQFCQFHHIVKITNINHQTKSINNKEIICKYLDYIKIDNNAIKFIFSERSASSFNRMSVDMSDVLKSLMSFMPKIKYLTHMHFHSMHSINTSSLVHLIRQFEKLESFIYFDYFCENTNFCTLAYSLNQLTHLKELALNLAYVPEDKIKSFSNILQTISQLKSFKLIQAGNVSNEHICHMIDKMPYLENLDLSEYQYDNLKYHMIDKMPYLENNDRCEYYTPRYWRDVDIIYHVMTYLKNLKVFKIHTSRELAHNYAIEEHIPICDSPANNLLELIIKTDPESFDHHNIDIFPTILKNHKKLEKLSIGNMQLRYGDNVDNLIIAIQELHQLKYLKISKVDMAPSNILTHLSKGFCQLSQLDTLILSNNRITSSDIELFSSVLIHLKNLQILDLGDNYIKDTGLLYLSSEISHCSKLINLNLSRNRITDQGIEYLSNALKDLNQLQILDLSYNNISTVSIKHINQSLIVFDMTNLPNS